MKHACHATKPRALHALQARHQGKWRQQLAAALQTGDTNKAEKWLRHHSGVLGAKEQQDVDDAFWVAVASGNAELALVIGRGGANVSAARPPGVKLRLPECTASVQEALALAARKVSAGGLL